MMSPTTPARKSSIGSGGISAPFGYTEKGSDPRAGTRPCVTSGSLQGDRIGGRGDGKGGSCKTSRLSPSKGVHQGVALEIPSNGGIVQSTWDGGRRSFAGLPFPRKGPLLRGLSLGPLPLSAGSRDPENSRPLMRTQCRGMNGCQHTGRSRAQENRGLPCGPPVADRPFRRGFQ